MMRMLMIDEATKNAIANLIRFAQDKANWYRPAADKWVPGDHPEYVVHLNDYRCVFTLTESEGHLFRHLSVSVPSKDYPNVSVFLSIAKLFGFTGGVTPSGNLDFVIRPGQDWRFGVNEDEHCVAIVQEIPAV